MPGRRTLGLRGWESGAGGGGDGLGDRGSVLAEAEGGVLLVQAKALLRLYWLALNCNADQRKASCRHVRLLVHLVVLDCDVERTEPGL